jgi:hypothetical protein
MQITRIVFKSMILGTSIFGLSLAMGEQIVRAESGMPPGYTRSKTPIQGKHCYYHGGDRSNYYCYSQKLNPSAMKRDSMMKKDRSMMKQDAMMKKDDSMMNHDVMMKKNGSMMKQDAMMKK